VQEYTELSDMLDVNQMEDFHTLEVETRTNIEPVAETVMSCVSGTT